jgi:hypothetical protein
MAKPIRDPSATMMGYIESISCCPHGSLLLAHQGITGPDSPDECLMGPTLPCLAGSQSASVNWRICAAGAPLAPLQSLALCNPAVCYHTLFVSLYSTLLAVRIVIWGGIHKAKFLYAANRSILWLECSSIHFSPTRDKYYKVNNLYELFAW